MKPKILIIEDEPIIADGIQTLLQGAFGSVAAIEKTYSSTKGFELLADGGFQLAVCDINMPAMNGIQLKDRLRGLGILVPIIFLTGYNDFNYAYDALKSQNVSFILKNEPDELLLSKVDEALRAAAAAPPPHTDTLPEKIDEYIAENILNAVNLTTIAEHFDYNPFYLSRIFKKEKGVSLLDYLNDLKIKKCIELLSSSDIRIEELARKMGYSSASSFLVFFKKQTKKTPNQFRRH